MDGNIQSFGKIAQGLARGPLGIIALFIVMVYGFASLVTAFAGSLTITERLPLIYFLIIFPAIVLFVFAWLVSKHHVKLYPPGDFKNEDNFVKMQMAVVASLTAASAKGPVPTSEYDLHRIVDVARSTGPARAESSNGWRNHILWVDDHPENNIYERHAFEVIGFQFTLALSTDEAFEILSQHKYVAIISDMGRREGPREGYVLLDRFRQEGGTTPLFFYASSNAPEHKHETYEHGGQGCTNNANELFEMVTKSVIRREVL